MTDHSQREFRIRTRRGRWTRVYAEADGKDASHLGYASKEPRLGAQGKVRMAGIGGVGTEPEFRRLGLAGRVLAKAMERITQDGYSCVGLFTSTEIVAHRLYRRFGLVDIRRQRPAYKILDPERFFCDAFSQMVRGDQQPALHRRVIELNVDPHPPIHLQFEEGRPRPLPGAPRKRDLTLRMSTDTFVALWRRDISLLYAEAAKLLAWQGKREVYQSLVQALASWHRMLNGA